MTRFELVDGRGFRDEYTGGSLEELESKAVAAAREVFGEGVPLRLERSYVAHPQEWGLAVPGRTARLEAYITVYEQVPGDAGERRGTPRGTPHAAPRKGGRL